MLNTYRDIAVRIGTQMARKYFERRGNHSEVHLSEKQLAGIMAVAFEMGAESMEKAFNSTKENAA